MLIFKLSSPKITSVYWLHSHAKIRLTSLQLASKLSRSNNSLQMFQWTTQKHEHDEHGAIK